MEGLGELGFWLAVGAAIVAMIVRGWLTRTNGLLTQLPILRQTPSALPGKSTSSVHWRG